MPKEASLVWQLEELRSSKQSFSQRWAGGPVVPSGTKRRRAYNNVFANAKALTEKELSTSNKKREDRRFDPCPAH